ncbi:hypothetical protein ABWJ92_23855 [Streptomyces sp. NPDC000609]|uniref:hypothetical protein n=1 Tax=Streptomyces sp. NPDC000609 TaxID=3160957 RepID=UPI003398245F
MKRRSGVVGIAVVCALLGLQAGTGSASAIVGGEAEASEAVVATAGSAGGPAGFPYVSSVAAQPDDGTRAATVRAAGKSPRHDYDGDGRDDLAAFYEYSDTRAKAITFLAKADGTLGDALHSWSEPKGWTLDRVHMFERYSSPPPPLPVCPVVYGHGGYPTGENA